MPNAKTKSIGVAAVLALGAALRLWGLGFGLPLISNFYVRPDESLIVQAALLFFERHGHPQFFAYPALLVDLCALLFAALPWDFATYPSSYFVAVRAVSAIAGITTIAVVYLLARRWCDWRWALAAAAIFAVAPLPVRDAHFGVTDSLMTLLVALTLWLAVRYVQDAEHSLRLWVWTAVLFGLAVSAKYTAALAAPVLLASALGRREQPWRLAVQRLALAGGIVVMVFAVLNPYVFLRMGEVADTVIGMFRVFYGGAEALPESHWSWSVAAMQVLRPLAWGPGSWAGLLLAALSLLWLRRPSQSPPGLWVLVLGVFAFLLALLPFRHPLPFRYVLPALPGLTMLAVFVASRLAAQSRIAAVSFAALGIGVFAWQLTLSVALVRTLAEVDTRTQAGQWIAANVPNGVPIVLLSTPEAEPQITESAASLERRIAYVYRLYGEHSGTIVSELYRLLLAGAGEGREVYRNPAPGEVTGDERLLVLSGYPMRTAGALAISRIRDFGEERNRVEFNPIDGPMTDASLDQSDAFYLPMNPWGKVSRPGPHLLLVRVRRTPLP